MKRQVLLSTLSVFNRVLTSATAERSGSQIRNLRWSDRLGLVLLPQRPNMNRQLDNLVQSRREFGKQETSLM